MVLLHPRVDDPVRRLAVVHHDRRPVDRGHHHLVRVRVAVVHVVGAGPVQRVVGHVVGRRRAGLQVARQRRRRRVVLEVVRHDHAVDRGRQAAGTGRYAAALALLRPGVVHQGRRRLLRLERHVPAVVHLVRAVAGRRVAVIRRRLSRARVHGLDLLLIVSLIVAATAAAATCTTAAAAAPAQDVRTHTDAVGHLLMVTAAAAAAAVLVLLVVVVAAVVRLVMLVMVVVMGTGEKVRRAHVVLHVAVVVRRRVLGLWHHHLVHLRRLMVRQRVVREKRIHRWRIQHPSRTLSGGKKKQKKKNRLKQ